MYSSEKNVQILLALLKAHGIKKMVLSPGSANASFVASVQNDSDFELYSSVDERSAAYIACGLAEEAGEPVVICCTGATASRNYMPGLTEAFYRRLPIIAVTATRSIALLGQNKDQLIDRTVVPKDLVVKSVHLPVVNSKDEEWECNLKVNDALLEARRNGNGPVHINLTTSYSTDFSIKKLPNERVIKRYNSVMDAPLLKNGNIAIFVGAHTRWSKKLVEEVDKFCYAYDAVVLCDSTSNYCGKYGVPCGMFDIAGFPEFKIDLLIHLGNISASWPCTSSNVWRVHPDGEIRDTYKKLTVVFEMNEETFFEHYSKIGKVNDTKNYRYLMNHYTRIIQTMLEEEKAMPFSSLWIAQNMYRMLPKKSVLHLGILNSLRCWNCYKLDSSIRGYSNTGGFGIDGGVSSLIGASLHDQKSIYFGIFGDLAFFYDMNSLGNRHIGPNVRIIVANNGLGGEFKNSLGNVQKAGLGDKANDFISAYGHYGKKSPELLKHFAQDLGFAYLKACSKEEFKNVMEIFLSDTIGERPMLLEVFLDDHEDVAALNFLQEKGFGKTVNEAITDKTKQLAKSLLGETGVNFLKKVIH